MEIIIKVMLFSLATCIFIMIRNNLVFKEVTKMSKLIFTKPDGLHYKHSLEEVRAFVEEYDKVMHYYRMVFLFWRPIKSHKFKSGKLRKLMDDNKNLTEELWGSR